MIYPCTRGGGCEKASYAILRGIAGNGGLYMPDALPRLGRDDIASFADAAYHARAARTLAYLLNDYSPEELYDIALTAYASFDTPEVAPVLPLDDNTHMLELFHGPTLAFKDMALQALPRLLTTAAKKQGEKRGIAILTATSGDTGKAALSGFQDVPGTSVTVFYPLHGVSRTQERQMLTSPGKNVYVVGIYGDFDDAQNGVKHLFTNPAFIDKMNTAGRMLSSANSINLGRLAPQVAYFLSSCALLLRRKRITWDKGLVVCVPTGNFGDILAAWYAKRMGAPISRLICASNANNVLTDFFHTGVYNRARPLHKTLSPSMDILVSSNLERYLYELADGDAALLRSWMQSLAEDGQFDVGGDRLKVMGEHFYAGFANDDQTCDEILHVYQTHHYVMDPHTAVASHVLRRYRQDTGDDAPALIVSTASPYKFAADVLYALGVKSADEADAFRQLSLLSRTPIPAPLAGLLDMPLLHGDACSPGAMGDVVLQRFGWRA